ncbi:MAG: sigma-70 family RNA polymerase sigma factor [Saprospiraceae bacterium]|nr:sigma-70 family RNA polymerase sigma factor [Saprospiraceae bacterium]
MKVVSIFSKFREQSLESILAGCVRKDAQCQRMLFDRCAPKILTTCRRYEMQGLDAQDILQETFINVFAKIEQYNPQKAAIETWINRIAIHIALKSLNKKQHPWVELERIADVPDVHEPDANEWDDWSEEQILAKIQELPPGYRAVFNLYVIDEFSHAEIAETLGISVQTSKSQLFKAKAMLRQKLTAPKKNLKYALF